MKESNEATWWGLNNRDLRLFAIFFAVALIARGAVLGRGFSVDDYSLGQGFTDHDRELFRTQGRFLLIVVDSLIDSMGVNINDMYTSLGLTALGLQAALVVSVMRFVGATGRPGSALIGSLMIAHPYLAEILTFRMVLPGYCLGALLTIVALEAASWPGTRWPRNLAISMLATLGMLFIYQGFLNYLAVALVFSILYGTLLRSAASAWRSSPADFWRRSLHLLAVCAVSAVGFLVIMGILRRLQLLELTGRAQMIGANEIAERFAQLIGLISKVYWLPEPMGAQWIKVLLALLMGIAGGAVLLEIFFPRKSSRSSYGKAGALILTLAVLPLTAGVILPFKDWWPVPRVLVQVSLIAGLVVLLGWSLLLGRFPRLSTKLLALPVVFLIVAFVFKNNQVFADQQRLNVWDSMKANRVVARLEENPDFQKVSNVFVGGGRWAHAARLGTIQGDLNISSFYPGYTKVPLLVEASGYGLKPAIGEQVALGEKVCGTVPPWPSRESVSIVGNLAIVCLGD